MQPSDFKLRKDPDPILYRQLEDYDFASGMDAEKIAETMITIMEQEYGIGISANQVGFDRRVIVIKPKGQQPLVMFNPVIIGREGQSSNEEGCLSFPGLFMQIRRAQTVSARYLDKNAKECTITLTDMDAKCLQHEIDHLDGIVFINHVSKMKLDLARKRQRKLLNGRTQ